MTLEDPFYVVKDEVFRALNKTRGLYIRWQEVTRAPLAHCPEAEWTSTELKNSIRSIEWDLEDLEDTIYNFIDQFNIKMFACINLPHKSSIVERNSSKFKIDNKEISERRTFIEATKQEVKVMKGVVVGSRRNEMDGTREPLLGEESPSRGMTNMGGSGGATWGARLPGYPHYRRLPSASPTRFLGEDDIMSAQDKMLLSQDDQLHVISNSVGSLKTVSKQIGIELDEQAVMLDDLNTELENADSKLDSTLKKVARVLHMNNDRRQWLVIGILLGVLFIILILFVIL